MSKLKRVFRTCRLDEVPPFCFMKPGMTPEEGALAAVKAMGMTHPIDALETLLRLRDARQEEEISAIHRCAHPMKPSGRSKALKGPHNSTHKRTTTEARATPAELHNNRPERAQP